MRFFSGLLVAASASVGTVQLNSKVAASIGDLTLGKVLANQLKLAPKIDTVDDAKAVGAWSSSMFEKPAGVFLAVLDGASDGVALDSSCEPTKECVGEACYETEVPCVARTLLGQSKTQLPADARAAGATVFLSDDVATGDADEQLRKVAKVERHGTDLTVTVGEASATLDTTSPCVQRLVGEASSILSAKAELVVLTPRSVSCMRAQYGNTEATKVATALISEAVKTAQKQNAGSFSAIVHVQSKSASGVTEVKPPVLIEERRLDAVELLKVPVAAGVANFHIYGWTSLGMVLALLAAVYSILSMTNDRDPLLYAKFRPEVDATSRR